MEILPQPLGPCCTPSPLTLVHCFNPALGRRRLIFTLQSARSCRVWHVTARGAEGEPLSFAGSLNPPVLCCPIPVCWWLWEESSRGDSVARGMHGEKRTPRCWAQRYGCQVSTASSSPVSLEISVSPRNSMPGGKILSVKHHHRLGSSRNPVMYLIKSSNASAELSTTFPTE